MQGVHAQELPGEPAEADGAVSAAAAASSATSNPARRAPLVWTLDIQAPGALHDLLHNYLDLARYQEASSSAVGTGIRISRGELRRLVAAAPEQVRSLLEAEGYFSAQIHTSVSDEVAGQAVVIRLVVDPGPKTRIGRVQMVFEGELDTLLSTGDASAKALVAELDELWALPVGEVFKQAGWSAAKNSMLARLRSEGYPLATWSGSAATIDAQQQTANLFVVADSGPLFHFGDIFIEGLQKQSASTVLNLAPFSRGQPYREQALLDFQERLQKLNMFDNVFVTLTPDPALADAAAVTVQLRELPLQQATVGVGASSDTGPRISAEHLHRRFMGWDWMSKTKLQLGRAESTFQADFTSDPLPERKRWLVSMELSRQLDSARTATGSQRLRLGQLHEGDRLERTRYVEFQRASVTSESGDKVAEASALAGTMQWIWRAVDNPLLPTTGITAVGAASLGRSFATLDSSGFFGRTYGRLTWYKPLPGGWYSTSRVEGGRVLAPTSVSVPDTLLFRAGGDESVRGYGYRDLGVTVDGVTVGGRAMVTASAEVAHPIMAKYPSILGALFFDVGGVANQFSEISPHRGYGLGVRWRSPVGPLRLDLGYGEQSHRLRVHFSVGISL
ncbi:MAG: BamA/TamA family outer membrane protein [Burkholderiales bacterium]|nr:BamA/TamA family outer membrane protein [Burkholderiales bacterium]